MKNKFKFLVTGGAGFIGSHLSDFLLKNHHHVTILDNFCHSSHDNLTFLNNYHQENYKIIEGDIRDKDCCLESTKNIDYILHQAAIGSVPRSLTEPELYLDNNVRGTLNILLAARDNNVKKVVQASSSSVYGDTPTLPKVETMKLNPKSPYAMSKLSCENYGTIFTEHYNLPVISLRYFNVFGPRQNPFSQYAAVIPLFVKSILNNKQPTIFGNGSQTRDFTYIDNVVHANFNSCFCNNEANGKAFNIGGNNNISVNELLNKITILLNSEIKPVYMPKRQGDVKDSLAAIDLARSLLNYNNKICIDEGLKMTLNWYVSQLSHTV